MKNWKRAISLALVLIMAVCLLPSAALRASAEIFSGDDGYMQWEYDDCSNTLTVSGTGDMLFNTDCYEEYVVPWSLFSIRTAVIEEGITSIGPFAFSDQGFLSSISIPNTVTKISAFAFYECCGLTSVVIPDSVQYIGYDAFGGVVYYCSNLKTVTFGSGLTEIGSYAFEGCVSLTDVELPENLTSIGDGAFCDCQSITGVRIPDSVNELGPLAFYSCSALRWAEVGENVPELQERVFANNPCLEEVLLPEGLVTISDSAFLNTPSLKDIYYGGDWEAWNRIDGAENIDLTTVRLHCGVEQIDGHWTGEEYAPSCVQPGFLYKTCPCGYVIDEELPALGHSMGAWTANNDGTHFRNCAECGQAYETAACIYEEVVTPPTATEPGFTVYTCTVCGYSYTDDYTEALGEDFPVHFSVPAGLEQPADMISNTRTGVILPTVGAPEGYAFAGWVLEDYDNVEVCPETVLTGSYTAPCEITLKALFRYVPVSDLCYELVTEKLPESEKPGRYVLTTGKTVDGYMMRAVAGSYTGNPEGMTRISASGASLENGVLRDVPLENVFQVSESDTGERYYLSPVTMPERYVSIADTSLLTTTTELSDSCKWWIGYASRTGRFGFLPHTDETQCINCDGAAFVLTTIQGNSGQFLWKERDAGTVYYTTVISCTPMETDELNIYSNISVGTDMVVNLTVRKSEVINYERFWIELVKHEPEGDKTFLYGEGQPDGELTEKESTWSVRFTEICAKEMGVGLDARLCAEDENGQIWVGPVHSANIRDYLAGRLTATNNKVEQRVLAADMLNYGAAAQMFMDYETDHLVNQELTEEQLSKLREYETKELPTVNKNNYNTRPEGQSNIIFVSVTLGNEVLVNLKVVETQGNKKVQVLVKDHETGATVATLDADKSDFIYKEAIFSGIGADKMHTEYDFVSFVDGVETGNTRTWSLEGYVGEIRADANQLKTDLANALLIYGDSAAAYFAAQ